MAAPNTMTPGQTNDPLWERILTENWNSHGNQFGVDWHGPKTTEAERAEQWDRMNAAYINETTQNNSRSSGSGGSKSAPAAPPPPLPPYTPPPPIAPGSSTQAPRTPNDPDMSKYMVGVQPVDHTKYATPTPGAPNLRSFMDEVRKVDPRDWQPEGAFVENRLAGILATDSPLMQRARTQGMQYANQRGLLNSTMAAGAAQGAMIDRAMPIAQDDAGFVRDMNKLGMGYETDLGKASHQSNLDVKQMGLQHQQNMSKLSAEQQHELATMGFAHDLGVQRDSHSHNLSVAREEFIAGLDRETRTQLAHLQNGFDNAAQYSNNATSAFNSIVNAMAVVNSNPELSPAQQQTATTQLQGMLEANLNWINVIHQ